VKPNRTFGDLGSTRSTRSSTALSWLIAFVLALTAEFRAIRSSRIASTGPLLVFAVAVARPYSTARAAASAEARMLAI
jgi:hypothetical protein